MSSLIDVFDDAHRRVCIARGRNEDDRGRMWTGMNYPREMREAVEKGYMSPLGRERHRVVGWYQFTEKGWAKYDQIFSEAPDYFSDAYRDFHISYNSFRNPQESQKTDKSAAPKM